MANLHFILLVFAFVLFVLSSIPYTSPYWARLIGAGLACYIAALLFG